MAPSCCFFFPNSRHSDRWGCGTLQPDTSGGTIPESTGPISNSFTGSSACGLLLIWAVTLQNCQKKPGRSSRLFLLKRRWLVRSYSDSDGSFSRRIYENSDSRSSCLVRTITLSVHEKKEASVSWRLSNCFLIFLSWTEIVSAPVHPSPRPLSSSYLFSICTSPSNFFSLPLCLFI